MSSDILKGTPKPGLMIQIYSDEGIPWLEGKWVLYKNQKKGISKGRFMILDEFGNWTAAIEEWKDSEGFKYL